MKTDRTYKRIVVSKKGENWLGAGHPWLYGTDILRFGENIVNGELVDVTGEKGNYIGTGFYSEKSKINVRIISRNCNDKFDEDFFRRRLKYAWDYRKTVMGSDIDCCRVIFGEADNFPGLTVDKFNDILVTQTLSFGIEKIKAMIFRLLLEVIRADGIEINGIYERNDVALRTLEGLEQNKGWFEEEKHPTSTETVIAENGIKYKVDFENGQKTGFFLDQKYNRLAVSKLAKGKKVLDCFTHTGSFAMNAAKGGADTVFAVDISEDALNTARENAKLNELEKVVTFGAADVFDLLPEVKKGEYDLIVLDPPAFTKSRKTVDSAYKGYKEINLRAMKALPRGGILATCSCSHFMPHVLFEKMLRSAAIDASVELRQIEERRQAPDHPILWNVPETEYLKFYIFQVV